MQAKVLRALARLVAGAALSAVPGALPAATPLLISPTIVAITPARRSAAIEITNQSDETVDLQLRGYDWTQPTGSDALSPSASLVVSPAIATVAPRAKQIFRILDVAPPGATERAFRIRINELPGAGRAGAVAVKLEFLVPVFRTGGEAPAELRWTRDGTGVAVDNVGGRHARLVTARLVGPDGRPRPVAGADAAYVLAGSRRTFPAAAQAGDRLVGATDLGPFDVTFATGGE